MPIVLVTGSSGLIGSHLTAQLQDKYQVIGLDKVGDPTPSPKVENINFDITSEESIAKALERVKNAYGDRIASVIHLAAYYDFSGAPSPLYEEVTVKGTQKFLKALQKYKVDQFVFSSTNLIYKPTEPGQKIAEDCPLQPNWDYPESKVDTEEIIREERKGIPAVILRLAGVYDEQGDSIPIVHQIQRIYEKDFTSHLFSGDTSHGNVFLHLEDLIDALLKTVEKRNELPEEIYINIGEPETPSYLAIQDTIGLQLYGEEWTTLEIPKPVAKAGAWIRNQVGDPFIKPWMIDRSDEHYELDISRARDLLGWQPQHKILDTIPAMIQNLKADPVAWYKKNKLDPSSIEGKKQEQEKSD
ncbi:nucleoside-diphosphate sugar epimerase [Pontibacter korlensis]|uniref:Nucleoside-diphosphate sugar epimerase n=2 Tax=Pontibacter korlensis TaxID=400092 RepID=A0A0E3V057_9BACT|nr:nucleoside-diphosphate sugar epimerase [Pontibacter korlensis]